MTGKMKYDKSPLKKIMIPEELAQEILKRKQDNDGEEYLINISSPCLKKKLKEYTKVCLSFDLVVRKIVISALFFSKYLVLWKYRSSILPRKSDNILK